MCFSLSRIYQNNQFRISDHDYSSSRMYTFQQLQLQQSIAQNLVLIIRDEQRRTNKQEWLSYKSNQISAHGLLGVLANS